MSSTANMQRFFWSSVAKISPSTFGVEFEYLVKRINKNTVGFNPVDIAPILPDPEPTDERSAIIPGGGNPSSVAYLAQLCKDHGVSTTSRPGYQGSNEPHEWEFKTDQSVRVFEDDPLRDLYEGDAIEMGTPVYYVSGQENSGLEEVRRVLNVIQNNVRVHVPSSAGFHAHIRNGKLGFTLTHMINLLSIMYVFEKQIAVLPPNRDFDREDSFLADDKRTAFMLFFKTPSYCTLGNFLSGFTSAQLLDLFDTYLWMQRWRLWKRHRYISVERRI